MTGHLFVVDGDLTRIACDALLVPVDETWWVQTAAFANVLGMLGPGVVSGRPDRWPEDGMWLAIEGNLSEGGSFGDPDVWVGDVGRGGLPDSSHFAGRARSFVAAAAPFARERLRGADAHRRPLLCVNVLGSGAGGKRSQRGQLVEALVPELIDAAIQFDSDIVLVCHGRVMYSAVQAVRRRLADSSHGMAAWTGLESNLQKKADELAAIARSGRLVLFMGAGISADVDIPAWKPLLESLARDSKKFTDEELAALVKLDPRDQALLIEGEWGRAEFRAALGAKMKATRHGLAHALLASLPCSEHVTTNFDDLFERACDRPGQGLSIIPGDDATAGGRWLLKLHGTLGGDLVFTRSDYFSATSTHAALRGIVQAMLLTRHMLFVGYSLSDEDFHQLVHEVREAKGGGSEPMGTALFPESNPHLGKLWRDLEIVSPGDGGLDFAERVRRLWITVDWIGMQSSSHVAHLADDSFGEMRTDVESELSELVARLASLRSRVADVSGAGWHELDHFLSRFGSHG